MKNEANEKYFQEIKEQLMESHLQNLNHYSKFLQKQLRHSRYIIFSMALVFIGSMASLAYSVKQSEINRNFLTITNNLQSQIEMESDDLTFAIMLDYVQGNLSEKVTKSVNDCLDKNPHLNIVLDGIRALNKDYGDDALIELNKLSDAIGGHVFEEPQY